MLENRPCGSEGLFLPPSRCRLKMRIAAPELSLKHPNCLMVKFKNLGGNMLDLLGIGVQKSGTTRFYDKLSQHPAVSFLAGKDVHFWDEQPFIQRKI